MRKFQITVNGTTYMVDVEEIGGAPMAAAPVAPVAPLRCFMVALYDCSFKKIGDFLTKF